MSDFKVWRDRMIYHMCKSSQNWRKTLEFRSSHHRPVLESWLVRNNIDGINI